MYERYIHMCVCVCVCVFTDEIMDVSDLHSSEEPSCEPDGDEEEFEPKLLQKDLVVDRFTRAELNYKKVVKHLWMCVCMKTTCR